MTGLPDEATRALTVAWPLEHSRTIAVVGATVDVGEPVLDENRLIILPDEPRSKAEAAIVEYGDLLGVAYQCRRAYRSPKPCVFVTPDNQREAQQLANAEGITAPLLTRGRPTFLSEIRPGADLTQLLSDRLDGLSFLADSLAEDGGVGRVHDLFRLFERAFRRGPSECIDPVAAFLATGWSELQYTRAEVEHWFHNLRPLTTHADRREEFHRGPDVEPYLNRIEYAAYDVLFNKATWRHPSPDRRPAMRLLAGTDDDRRTVVVRGVGNGTTIVMPWTDPFGVFSIDPGAKINVPPPSVSAMPGYTFENPRERSTQISMRTTSDED